MYKLRLTIVLLLVLPAFTVQARTAFATDTNSTRMESITGKMNCNCGCGQLLSECAHVRCERKIALKQEITDALLKGDTDAAILEQMGAKYGATILAAPKFKWFSTLLWSAPFAVAVIALAFMLNRPKRNRA